MVMECALEAGAEPCRLLRTRRAGGRGTRLRICNYRFSEAVDCLGQLLAEAAFEKSCSWDKLPQTGPKLVDGDFGGDDAVRTSAASDFAEDNMEGEACGHRQEPIHPGGGNFSARRGKGRG
uniref:Uncharacterized protein n=1 Tax=Oryza sativa subsp. japonica TaxID=39947 RepID=Q2R2Z5_ORYSJ|nr:hypothetical protein LOC_Os11g34170 [Oryza sativa Japonica Group]